MSSSSAPWALPASGAPASEKLGPLSSPKTVPEAAPPGDLVRVILSS